MRKKSWRTSAAELLANLRIKRNAHHKDVLNRKGPIMTAEFIDAGTLKTLRKARKFGRPKLAKLAGLTERQIARFEGAAGGTHAATPDVISRLSAILQVPEETLTGSEVLTEYDLTTAPKSSCSCCS